MPGPVQDVAASSAAEQTVSASVSTKQEDQQITLLDHTKSEIAQDANEPGPDCEVDPAITRTLSDQILSRRWTKSSLQHQLAQRKYARYREDRVIGAEQDELQPTDEATGSGNGRIRKGKNRVKALMKRKKAGQRQEEDAVIDILYENQRGTFFVGIPLFSSRSLLNFDPKAWVNAHWKASPVNITNAQVPDPEWEWAWKSWYVDMSRDVDEEGWEYSFSFQNGFAWHGNHPWFHSFVRRRRWLRKRVRKHTHHIEGTAAYRKHMAEGHMLTSDYFTIHASKAQSLDSSREPSLAASSGGLLKHFSDDDDEYDKADIRDIATLLLYLKKAAIDREKIVLVRNFVANANEELYYLGEEMHSIMSMFIFQNSRRNLLGILMERFEAASEHREQHQADQEQEGVAEKRRIDNLLKAVHAADEEVKRLEYWSDIRRVTRKGDTVGTVNNSNWDAHEWKGLDNSGPAVSVESEAKEPGKTQEELHQDAEIIQESMSRRDEGGSDADTEVPEQSREADSMSGGAADEPSSSDTAYTTAEQPLEEVDKGKGRAV